MKTLINCLQQHVEQQRTISCLQRAERKKASHIIVQRKTRLEYPS